MPMTHQNSGDRTPSPEDVRALLGAVRRLKQNHLAKARHTAPDHNLFRLLRLERSEIWLHSPFLADLLDPYGTHGQGGLFLRHFLVKLAGHDAAMRPYAEQVEDVPPPEEWQVFREYERIDISIWNRRRGLLLFIENKIDAGEQPDQLSRYRCRLEEYRNNYPFHRLVFLAPESHGPPTSGESDIRLTYERDVRCWLAVSLVEVSASRVRASLEQYLEIISQFNGGYTMSDRKELIDLLSKDENIATALHIQDAMQDVKTKLQRRFWEAVEGELQKGLKMLHLPEKWTIERSKDVFDNPVKMDAGLRAVLRPPNGHAQLVVGVWVEARRLFYGVAFVEEKSKPHDLSAVHHLRTEIEDELKAHNDWYLGWKLTDVDLHDVNTLKTLASNPAATVGRVSELVLGILRKHHDALVAADAALAAQ